MSRLALVDDLSRCRAEIENNLDEIKDAPSSNAPIDPLKRESVRIEGRMRYLVEQLETAIRQDSQIPSDRRASSLATLLSELSINLDDLAVRRRLTVSKATQALADVRSQSVRQARERLLGDDATLELKRTMALRAKSTSTLAADITARLSQTRDLIQAQVAESQRSLELLQQSTAELRGVNDAAGRVEVAQGWAHRTLVRLRIAQNWDRWLFHSSLWFFAIVVVYVIIRGLPRNMFVVVLRLMYRGLKKVLEWVVSGARWVIPTRARGEAIAE
jgi:hypothetical protein